MVYNEQTFQNDWEYWHDRLTSYKYLDSLSDKQFKRTTLSCLLFIIDSLQFIAEHIQPERSKREDRYIGGYFPPPWNPDEHPEKTEGWVAFQEEQRKDPKYYGCGALNTQETE